MQNSLTDLVALITMTISFVVSFVCLVGWSCLLTREESNEDLNELKLREILGNIFVCKMSITCISLVRVFLSPSLKTIRKSFIAIIGATNRSVKWIDVKVCS